MGKPLVFEHAADDREAIERSTEILVEGIERLIERSAKRLLECKLAFDNPYARIQR